MMMLLFPTTTTTTTSNNNNINIGVTEQREQPVELAPGGPVVAGQLGEAREVQRRLTWSKPQTRGILTARSVTLQNSVHLNT